MPLAFALLLLLLLLLLMAAAKEGALVLTHARRFATRKCLFLPRRQMIFGPAQTGRFFQTRWQKVGPRGVVCFFLGICMVMFHKRIWVHPTFGVAMEIFGFLNLFGNFFPLVISWARHMPVRPCSPAYLLSVSDASVIAPSSLHAIAQILNRVLDLPGIKQLCNSLSASELPTRSKYGV